MTLKDAFETSFGRKNAIEHLVVKATDESGLVGWGETTAPTKPDYCPETTQTCWHIQRDYLIPAVLGRSFETVEEFLSFFEWVRGNQFAKGGIEMAIWDILAQREGISLSKLLGGTKDHIISGVSLGLEPTIESLMEKVDKYVAQGYKRVKLKVKPGRDHEIINAVHLKYPDLPIMMDANSAYTVADIPHLKTFDQYNLMMIEQPLAYDDIVDHAKLQKEITTPVCLDESIHSVEDTRKAIELGSLRMLNIKIGRVGGLLSARKIHELCQAANIPVWCGGMHEFGIGRAHNVAISSLPNFTVPGDVSGSDKYYHEDITDPPILAENGRIPVSPKPGLGYAINHKVLEKHTLATHKADASD
jgi:O-succinylbenzoate synthase